VVAADLLGGEGEGVEGGDDVELAVGCGVVVAAAAGGEGGGRGEAGDGHENEAGTAHDCTLPSHDNHCQHLICAP
jgi:hypothetical protein